MTSRTKKILFVLVILVVLLALAAAGHLFFNANTGQPSERTPPNSGFNPFGRTPPSGGHAGTSTTPTNGTSTPAIKPIPALRLLSEAPVGGFGASTTASTTVIRWVDRGRGNVYEARGTTLAISTLSNTVLPRVYDSSWNKNLTAFIGSLAQDSLSDPSVVYAELKARSTTPPSASSTQPSADSLSPFTLKGKNLPAGVVAYAISPKRDRLFTLIIQDGKGVGYVSAIEGGSVSRLFDTPLTKINVEWPSDNVIAVTTKGNHAEGGFLYFVDAKTGVWQKILGPLPGLSTKVSRDAKYVLLSATGNKQNALTSIYDISKQSSIDAIIHTIADKCAWGNFYRNMVYCGVPAQATSATYPDDWYLGTVSLSDKIWQVNADTGEVHLVSAVSTEGKRDIDAFNLGLDPKDEFLIFMNKNDLSLWSLDLVTTK